MKKKSFTPEQIIGKLREAEGTKGSHLHFSHPKLPLNHSNGLAQFSTGRGDKAPPPYLDSGKFS